MRVLFVAALLAVLAPAVPAAQEITRPRHLTLHAGEIYFITGSTGAIDFWRTDGTSGGTVTIARLSGVINVTRMVSAGAFLALTVEMESGGSAVWRSDGTAAGTFLLRDFDSQVCPSAPALVTAFRGGIVFVVGAANGGNEIWRSEGTPATTRRMFDASPHGAGASVASLTPTVSLLFYTIQDGLWRTDGTTAGTVALREFPRPPEFGFPRELTASGSSVLFVAGAPETGFEVWRSDGTSAGTSILRDIMPGPDGSGSHRLTAVPGQVFFVARDPDHGRELWRSDGTTEGTRLVRDLEPGPDSGLPTVVPVCSCEEAPCRAPLAPVGRRVFFRRDTALWSSDGTEGDTVEVMSFDAIPSIRGLGGLLVVQTPDFDAPTFAEWLWIATESEPPVNVGSFRVSRDFAQLGRVVLFNGDQGDGETLWRSDGTQGGTLPVEEFEPSPPQCLGDCDATGAVTSADLRVLVDLVLSGDSSHSCPPGDRNRDLVVTVDEVVAAVLQARGGC